MVFSSKHQGKAVLEDRTVLVCIQVEYPSTAPVHQGPVQPGASSSDPSGMSTITQGIYHNQW